MTIRTSLIFPFLVAGMMTTPAWAQVEAELAQSVAELQASLPMKVNDMATLTGAKADGRQLTYEYKLNVDTEADGIEAMQDRYQTQSEENVCTDDALKLMLNKGVLIKSLFNTKDGKSFTTQTTKATLANCQ